MEDIRNAYEILVGKPGQTTWGHLRVDERMTLKCILENYGVREWTGFKWFTIRSSGGLL
jgi:hypothetical protein